jgi:hypothetical protein
MVIKDEELLTNDRFDALFISNSFLFVVISAIKWKSIKFNKIKIFFIIPILLLLII